MAKNAEAKHIEEEIEGTSLLQVPEESLEDTLEKALARNAVGKASRSAKDASIAKGINTRRGVKRGDKGEGPPRSSLARMLPKHHEMARRLMLGERPIDIARDFGMCLSSFYYVFKSPLFQAKLQELIKAADAEQLADMRRLRNLNPAAIALIEHVLLGSKDGNSDIVLEVSNSQRLESAWKLLKRTLPAEPGSPDASKDATGGAPAQILAQQGATVNIYQEKDPAALDRAFQELLRSLEGVE